MGLVCETKKWKCCSNAPAFCKALTVCSKAIQLFNRSQSENWWLILFGYKEIDLRFMAGL